MSDDGRRYLPRGRSWNYDDEPDRDVARARFAALITRAAFAAARRT